MNIINYCSHSLTMYKIVIFSMLKMKIKSLVSSEKRLGYALMKIYIQICMCAYICTFLRLLSLDSFAEKNLFNVYKLY